MQDSWWPEHWAENRSGDRAHPKGFDEAWTSLEGCESRTTALSNAVQGVSENGRNDADGFLGPIEGCITRFRAS